MTQRKRFNTTYFVQLAALEAILILMAFTPLGYFRTATLSVTLLAIPVATGAVVLGPAAGAVLGATFGITSLLQCFGMEPFGTALFGFNPIGTIFVCLVPRTLMGWLCAVLYKGFVKVKCNKKVAVVLGCLSAPVFNTIFFVSTLVIIFYQYLIDDMNMKNLATILTTFVTINGLIEAVVCTIIGSAVVTALQKVLKQA